MSPGLNAKRIESLGVLGDLLFAYLGLNAKRIESYIKAGYGDPLFIQSQCKED